LGWLQVLVSIPTLNLLQDLPNFLNGIFVMLSDKQRDIRIAAENVLAEFLDELNNSNTIDYPKIIEIIVPHCFSGGSYSQSYYPGWIHLY
jgi:vacuole morphology and inheritance protein 14